MTLHAIGYILNLRMHSNQQLLRISGKIKKKYLVFVCSKLEHVKNSPDIQIEEINFIMQLVTKNNRDIL